MIYAIYSRKSEAEAYALEQVTEHLEMAELAVNTRIEAEDKIVDRIVIPFASRELPAFVDSTQQICGGAFATDGGLYSCILPPNHDGYHLLA